MAGGGGLLFCRSWPDGGCTWTGTHKLKPIDMWGPELYPAAHLSLSTPRLTLLVSRRGIADFSSLFQAVGGVMAARPRSAETSRFEFSILICSVQTACRTCKEAKRTIMIVRIRALYRR